MSERPTLLSLETGFVVLRYMGTKRALAHHVTAIADKHGASRVADLFCGTGAVTAQFAASGTPVWANDLSPFIGVMARARSLPGRGQVHLRKQAEAILRSARLRRRVLQDQFARRIATESRLLQNPDHEKLSRYLSGASHVGSSEAWARAARQASRSSTGDRYQLATRYFSGGYFSTQQAVDLDALRYAIDRRFPAHEHQAARDVWLTIWLETAGSIMNSPGHSAQFLKATCAQSALRVHRQWERGAFHVFLEVAEAFRPWGDSSWRRKNRVTNTDTAEAVRTLSPGTLRRRCDLAYLDPPYTKDHYSRYYHVFETLNAYDFPDSIGEGRTRSDRVPSDFGYATRIRETLSSTVQSLLQADVAVLLSYPSNGLLSGDRGNAREVLESVGRVTLHWRFDHAHSRLASARGGGNSKAAVENLILVEPRD